MLSFDQGIAFSDQPLHDNEVFEVRIDQMMPLSIWRGSVEIGKAYTSAYHRPIVGKQSNYRFYEIIGSGTNNSYLAITHLSIQRTVHDKKCLCYHTTI